MMSSLILANFNSGSERSRLILIAEKLVSDTRLVQSMALSAAEFNSYVPAGGWGINFSLSRPDKYIIFADEDEDYTYDTLEKFREVDLGNDINIINISSGNDTSITFEPPDPITRINGINPASVQVKLSDGKTCKTVEINAYGLVDVLMACSLN